MPSPLQSFLLHPLSRIGEVGGGQVLNFHKVNLIPIKLSLKINLMDFSYKVKNGSMTSNLLFKVGNMLILKN